MTPAPNPQNKNHSQQDNCVSSNGTCSCFDKQPADTPIQTPKLKGADYEDALARKYDEGERNQTAEDFLKDKGWLIREGSHQDISATEKDEEIYSEEDVLKALALKEQEVKNKVQNINFLNNEQTEKRIRFAKHQAQQELWDEICEQNIEGDLIKLTIPDVIEIKKRFNLK